MKSQSAPPEGEVYTARFGSGDICRGQQAISSAVWTEDRWKRAQEAPVTLFSSKSSSHRPTTVARLLHDDSFFYLRFDVSDRFVVARAIANQSDVCRDSCVEWFVRPPGSTGYFNFEFNCGGTMLASFIEDPVRTPDGFKKFEMIDARWLEQIVIAHTLPKTIDPEIPSPVDWKLCCQIPFALLEHYASDIDRQRSESWECNFYKCADASSHPHWASWAPLGPQLNFHRPDRFGKLILAGE